MKRTEAQRVKEVLFRESGGTKCDIAEVSKRTGIPQATLRRYRREPDMIPLGRLIRIADAMSTSPGEAGYMITGRISR